MNQGYIQSVRLLLDAVPAVFAGGQFALKGGTAINLFVRDLPRLSVDLDLVYLDYRVSREEALATISMELKGIQQRLDVLRIESRFGGKSTEETKLFLERSGVRVKVEVNHIFRGTLLDTVKQPLVGAAQRLFFSEITVPMLNVSELYASKLVAALDRQHPRDLFDVWGLFEAGGLNDDIIECFVGYLAGHNRPIHEVLFARKADLRQSFVNEFEGMTNLPVDLNTLLNTRERLFEELPKKLSSNQRFFLLGLAAGAPDWGLMQCRHLRELPAIRWKLQNMEKLKRMNSLKFGAQEAILANRFDS